MQHGGGQAVLEASIDASGARSSESTDLTSRGVDIVAVVDAMRANNAWLNYVGLPTSRTVNHARYAMSKYARALSLTARGVHLQHRHHRCHRHETYQMPLLLECQ